MLPLVASLLWMVVAMRLVSAESARLGYETQAFSDTRYLDEVLTMSANMAAQTGDQKWIDRYRTAENELATSLSVALARVGDSQLAELLKTSTANDALVKLEHQALGDAEAGRLESAQSILASSEYASLKAEYAASVEEATLLYRQGAEQDVRTWTGLLITQFLLSLATVLVIGLLTWWLLRTRRSWADAEIGRRDLAVKAGEERFRRAMDESAIGMCLVATNGQFLEVNPAACAFFGYAKEDLCSRTWQELTHPDDVERDSAQVARVLRGEIDHYRLTKRYLDSSGNVLVGDLAVSGIHGPTGEVEYFVSQIVDITASTHAEEALATSERQFRLLAESATDVVYTVDRLGRVTWVSPSVTEVLGWSTDEVIGRDVANFMNRDDLAARATPALLIERAGAVSGKTELRFATKDGSWRWMSVTGRALLDDSGAVIGGRESLRDVSAEVEAREALAQSEHRFRLLAENATDLVYRTDPSGTIVWVAATVTDSLGWLADDLMGHSMLEFIHPTDVVQHRDEFDDFYSGVRASQHSSSPILLRLRTKEGPYRWVSSHATSVADDSGAFDGLVVGIKDVDDLVRARAEAERAREEEQRTRVSMESAAIGMALTSPEGTFLTVNPALCRMLGYTREELEGKAFADITHPDDRAPGVRASRDLAAGKTSTFKQRKRYLSKAGGVIWVDLSVAAVHHSDGTLMHSVAQVVDVTAEVANFEALQRTMLQYRVLAENASDIVYQADVDGVIRWVSPSIMSTLGWDPEIVVGTVAFTLVDGDDAAALRQAHTDAFSGIPAADIVIRLRTTRDDVRVMAAAVQAVSNPGDEVSGVIVSLHDVTDEHMARAALQQQEEQFRLALAGAPQGVALADSSGVFIQVNTALSHLLDLEEGDIVGHTIQDFLDPTDTWAHDDLIAGLQTADTKAVRHEHRLASADRRVWVDHSVGLLRDADGLPLYYVHHFSDQTETRALQAELEHRATHDSLTDVSNRRDLMNQLRDRLTSSPGGLDSVGVLFCDLDNLKTINDTHGHGCGDAIIAAAAERLRAAVRSQDVVGRVGGDEFVVVIDHVRNRSSFANLVHKVHAAVSGPVAYNGITIPLGVSIGATIADRLADPDAVLAEADQALYRAKIQGRDRAVISDETVFDETPTR